jgi:hypothetical protein
MTTAGLAYAVLGPAPAPGAILLVAQAGYHLDDLCPLVEELAGRGGAAAVVCPLPRPSVLRRWRSSWWRHRELLAAAASRELRPSSTTDAASLLAEARAVVVRNDWGVTRALVDDARARGVATFGWVEGVQDFADLDTGRARRPYRHVDHVLSLGSYDAGELTGTDVTPVGTERLWQAWHGPPTSATGPTVANVNFTYGVLEHARRAWVADVVAAAGDRPLVLSRHPADRGRRGRRLVADRPVEELLRAAPRLVTRFSTLCYEALALGVDLAYHNPHGERARTFAEPDGAFTVTRSRAELVDALATTPPAPDTVRARAAEFLGRHLVLDGLRPAQRATDAILERLGGLAH